jgi:condensin complex subunit 3
MSSNLIPPRAPPPSHPLRFAYISAPSEVRRAALIHTPLTASTVPALLTRTRDSDPITRKLLYASVLHTKLAHPRQLTIAQREQLVKDGLGDREPGVRLAAGKMLAAWFEIVLKESKTTERDESWEDDTGIMRGLVDFLQVFDVIGLGETVAVDAVLSIFVTRKGTLNAFAFNGIQPISFQLSLATY